MADLGFLPDVTALLAQTPRNAQRLLFSATLDGDVDALVRRFLTDPVTHELQAAVATVDTMDHHALLIPATGKFEVLASIANRTGPDHHVREDPDGGRPTGRPAGRGRRPGGSAARRQDPAGAHPYPGRVPRGPVRRADRDERGRARHSRRRGEPGRARGSAGRRQGLPAPGRPYRPRGREGHRGHAGAAAAAPVDVHDAGEGRCRRGAHPGDPGRARAGRGHRRTPALRGAGAARAGRFATRAPVARPRTARVPPT